MLAIKAANDLYFEKALQSVFQIPIIVHMHSLIDELIHDARCTSGDVHAVLSQLVYRDGGRAAIWKTPLQSMLRPRYLSVIECSINVDMQP